MIAQELVKPGTAWLGKDGEVRHVYMLHKPGNGYSVSWDSIPKPVNIQGIMAWWDTQDERPHGYMPMRKFQNWAVGAAPAHPGEEEEGKSA